MPTQEFSVESAAGPISLIVPEGVMAPSPYSRFATSNMPRMDGLVVADAGTGSGVLGIACAVLGAELVYVLDKNPAAIETATRNFSLNGYADRVVAMEAGDMLEPLDRKVDVIVCNPASLPMPKPDQPETSPYYAGEDGRDMISRLIADSPRYMDRGGGLLFVLTSMASLYYTQRELVANRFVNAIQAIDSLPLRDFYDKNWIDKKALRIPPEEERYTVYDFGPYWVENGVPYENTLSYGSSPRSIRY